MGGDALGFSRRSKTSGAARFPMNADSSLSSGNRRNLYAEPMSVVSDELSPLFLFNEERARLRAFRNRAV